MKKGIILLIALCLLMTAVAGAEEIVLPGGLKFGMSMSEATMVSGFPRQNMGPSDAAYYKAYGIPFGEYCLRQNIIINGMNARMSVFFDENGLCQILYEFESGDNATHSWLAVEDVLQQKYGSSIDPYQNRHMYMPPIDQRIDYSYMIYIDLFESPISLHQTASAENLTLRESRATDGSVIFIDNYLEVKDGSLQIHKLTYTFYSQAPKKNTAPGSFGF